jgi:hypothetical protein
MCHRIPADFSAAYAVKAQLAVQDATVMQDGLRCVYH